MEKILYLSLSILCLLSCNSDKGSDINNIVPEIQFVSGVKEKYEEGEPIRIGIKLKSKGKALETIQFEFTEFPNAASELFIIESDFTDKLDGIKVHENFVLRMAPNKEEIFVAYKYIPKADAESETISLTLNNGVNQVQESISFEVNITNCDQADSDIGTCKAEDIVICCDYNQNCYYKYKGVKYQSASELAKVCVEGGSVNKIMVLQIDSITKGLLEQAKKAAECN